VARIIDLSKKKDNKEHHLDDIGSDSTLLEIMVSDVKARKLNVYSEYSGAN
jgi:hypothetical protein